MTLDFPPVTLASCDSQSEFDLKIGQELCRALGIDSSAVRKVTLTCEVGQPPRVVAEYVTKGDNEFIFENRSFDLKPEGQN